MAFKVVLSASAERDLEKAIIYYSQINQLLPEKFHDEFIDMIELLCKQPFFEEKYDLVRTVKMRSFPSLAHFIVNEGKHIVKIIALIFGKRGRTNFAYRIFDL